MESIITIATVLTMYFNAANDVNAPYFYNSDLENGVIHKIEVYEQQADRQLCAKMEYHYEYDEQGRLASREVVRWDAEKKAWVNDFRHTYKYYKNGYNMETSKWDAEHQTYDVPTEVTLYREVAPSVTSVKTFRMNAAKNDMYLVNSLLCMEPLELISDRLLAQN
ncbi:MAG: DUF3836 domain-containing protein [Prevotella sp.]|nr:DUF3836 domain-containing protein [Prevotella sp.]